MGLLLWLLYSLLATNGSVRLHGKCLVVVLQAKVRDQIRAHNVP